MVAELDEEKRRVHEARFWLGRGYTTREKVDELMARIAKHRGREAAEQLRADMRAEWARRNLCYTEGT